MEGNIGNPQQQQEARTGIREHLMRYPLSDCSGFIDPLPDNEMKELWKRYRTT